MRSFQARAARTLSGHHGAIIASSLVLGIGTTVTLGAALKAEEAVMTPEPIKVKFVESASAKTSAVDTSPADDSTDRADESMQWFNGRPVRPVRMLTMRVTAYSPDAQSCGDFADGYTASGYSVRTNGGKLVAADSRILPLGSMITVPGYDAGNIVPVLDRGGAIKDNRLDVLFPTHEAALEWGVRNLDVIVWEYADGKPNDFKRGSYGN